MKLDYKLPLKKMGGLPKRLVVRAVLGCIALLCLCLAFHYKAPSTSSASQQLAESEKLNSELTLPLLARSHEAGIVNQVNQTNNDETLDENSKASNKNEISNQSDKATLKAISSDSSNSGKDKSSNNSDDKMARDQISKEKTLNKLPLTKNEPNKVDSNKANSSKTNPEKNWRVVTVKKGDTLAKIFKRYGYSKKDLHEILNANPKYQKQLASLKTNQILKLWLTPGKQVQGLAFDLPKGKTLHLAKKGLDSKIENKEDKLQIAKLNKQTPEKQASEKALESNKKMTPLQETGLLQTSLQSSLSTQSTPEKSSFEKTAVEKQIAFGKGTIRDSLFSAAKRAGLDHNVVAQMVEIFGWNIDFSFDLRPNDSFRVLFEEKYQEGERVATGAILAAEIINHGKVHRAIRYTDKSGRTGYFSPEGNGMRQAFLRYPLNFTRISSGFGQRHHPISHRMRHHKGIDYSAPAGTPVQATGDAKVLFIGSRGGYGKVIELAHGARYSTLYAHLSRFSKKLKIGSEVKQGDVIGYVGATGAATGNHLHYEFRIDGIHRDPQTVNVPNRRLIPDTHKNHFLAHAKEMLRLMDLHENKINMVRNEYPKNK